MNAVEAFNAGDGNYQTVVDRRSVHGLFDGQWQTRESWHLQTPEGRVVLDGAPWKHLKAFLGRIAKDAFFIETQADTPACMQALTATEPLETTELESPSPCVTGNFSPRG